MYEVQQLSPDGRWATVAHFATAEEATKDADNRERQGAEVRIYKIYEGKREKLGDSGEDE